MEILYKVENTDVNLLVLRGVDRGPRDTVQWVKKNLAVEKYVQYDDTMDMPRRRRRRSHTS